MSRLEKLLQRYDGKTIAILSDIRTEMAHREGFLSDLIALAGSDDAHVSDGATWLIKGCLEDGFRLTETEIEMLSGRLPAVSSWPAQLHLCQSFQFIDVPDRHAGACADWLTQFLNSERPFLRAWSMDALQYLAESAPRLKEQARVALELAENDPAASVRARARNWRKRAIGR